MMDCTNLQCSNQLTDFDIERQSPVKQSKFVFCRDCRIGWARGRILYWKCANCTFVLTSSYNPLYKKFCKLQCREQAYRRSLR